MSNNREMVSIILPTYNRAHCITRSLESVFRQTYQDWELIIVDDASMDNTYDVLRPYLADGRIKYYRLENNLGGAGARNIGMEKAEGEFLAFLDDDDEWMESKLEKQLEFLKGMKGIDIISCRYTAHEGTRVHSSEEVTLQDLLFENVLGSFSFCIIRRESVNGLRIDPVLKACQDWDLWVKILNKTGGKGFICQECLVRYNDSQTLRLTRNRKNALNAHILFLRKNRSLMQASHYKYNLAVICAKKNYIQSDDLLYKLGLMYKAIMYHRQSGYRFELGDLMKYFGHVFTGNTHLFRALKALERIITKAR